MKEETQNFGETHYAINHTNMCIIEVSELEGKKQGEKILEKIMAGNLTDMMKI